MAQPGKVRPKAPAGAARAQAAGPKVSTTTSGERLTAAERRAQRAAEAQQFRHNRQRRNIIIGAIGALLLLAVAGYLLRNQYINQGIGIAVPDEGRGHVNAGTTLTFKHSPPSSGTHYPTVQPAGVYREEVPEGNWVHSLEHGYVVILVKCTTDCSTIYSQLDELYKTLPKSKYGTVKLVVTPYSKPYTNGDSPLMLVAWDHEQPLATVDRDLITRFYTKFVDKGPEDVP